MDPLSIGAGAAGFTSLGIQLCQGLLAYYGSVKGARSDVERLRGLIERLEGGLGQVERLLVGLRGGGGVDKEIAVEIEKNLLVAKEGIQELEKKLQKICFTPKPEGGVWEDIKVAGRMAKYPFRESTIAKLSGIVHDSLTHLGLVLNALQLHVGLTSTQSLNDVSLAFEKFHLDSRTRDIHQWLGGIDTSIHYNAARKLRQQHTGEWLVKSPTFIEWKESTGSELWIFGKPGCGKTIISSTIIEAVYADLHRTPRSSLLFFYFRYDYKTTGSHVGQFGQMLRSIIKQLSSQIPTPSSPFDALYVENLSGERQPSDADLATLFGIMMKSMDHNYLILDALDECDDDLRDLLAFLTKLAADKSANLHLLVTSRYKVAIEQSLADFKPVHLEEQMIAEDIQAFVTHQLGRSEFDKLPGTLKLEIISKLAGDADGMFQWVVCQLDTIRACRNSSIAKIRSVLTSLPRTLEATYERILSKVDEEASDDLVKILEWVAFGRGPFLLQELQEAIAVDLNGASPLPRYEPDRKPLDAKYLLEICGPLFQTRSLDHLISPVPDRCRVTFSHFSVKEYLCSGRLRRHDILSKYHLEPKSANLHIGESCLAYLIYWEDKLLICGGRKCSQVVQDLIYFHISEAAPLFFYADCNFHNHCLCADEDGRIVPLAIKFYTLRYSQCNLNHPTFNWELLPFRRTSTPLIEASNLGMARTVQSLLSLDRTNIEQIGGEMPSTALTQAVLSNHLKIAEVLLASEANPNVRNIFSCGSYILHEAVMGQNLRMIRLLLDNGADPNVRDRLGDTPLRKFMAHSSDRELSTEAREVVRRLRTADLVTEEAWSTYLSKFSLSRGILS